MAQSGFRYVVRAGDMFWTGRSWVYDKEDALDFGSVQAAERFRIKKLGWLKHKLLGLKHPDAGLYSVLLYLKDQ